MNYRELINNGTAVIPNRVTEIEDKAFMACSQLINLRLDFENPDEAAQLLTSSYLDHFRISLYVPVGTGYAYRHHEIFKYFKEIIDTTVWPSKDTD